MNMLQALFPIFSFAGAIICGLCLAMGTSYTKWSSTLGKWSIAGLLFLLVGLLGWLYSIRMDIDKEVSWTVSPSTMYSQNETITRS